MDIDQLIVLIAMIVISSIVFPIIFVALPFIRDNYGALRHSIAILCRDQVVPELDYDGCKLLRRELQALMKARETIGFRELYRVYLAKCFREDELKLITRLRDEFEVYINKHMPAEEMELVKKTFRNTSFNRLCDCEAKDTEVSEGKAEIKRQNEKVDAKPPNLKGPELHLFEGEKTHVSSNSFNLNPHHCSSHLDVKPKRSVKLNVTPTVFADD